MLTPLIDLKDWYMSLAPDMMFLFALPFLVAAAALIGEAWRRRR
jgi:hypothetical protein